MNGGGRIWIFRDTLCDSDFNLEAQHSMETVPLSWSALTMFCLALVPPEILDITWVVTSILVLPIYTDVWLALYTQYFPELSGEKKPTQAFYSGGDQTHNLCNFRVCHTN